MPHIDGGVVFSGLQILVIGTQLQVIFFVRIRTVREVKKCTWRPIKTQLIGRIKEGGKEGRESGEMMGDEGRGEEGARQANTWSHSTVTGICVLSHRHKRQRCSLFGDAYFK